MSFLGVIFSLVFYFLFSIWLGAPLGLFLIRKNLLYFSILISYFCGMSFLEGIFDFSFLFSVFYLIGGSPRPVF